MSQDVNCHLCWSTEDNIFSSCFFFFQAEDGIRDLTVTGVQTCALPILMEKSLVVFAEDGQRQGRYRLLEPTRHYALVLSPLVIQVQAAQHPDAGATRSEERRVGKEGRSRWSPYH